MVAAEAVLRSLHPGLGSVSVLESAHSAVDLKGSDGPVR